MLLLNNNNFVVYCGHQIKKMDAPLMRDEKYAKIFPPNLNGTLIASIDLKLFSHHLRQVINVGWRQSAKSS